MTAQEDETLVLLSADLEGGSPGAGKLQGGYKGERSQESDPVKLCIKF